MMLYDVLVANIGLDTYRGETVLKVETAGCNLRCDYCHSFSTCLKVQEFIPLKKVLNFAISERDKFSAILFTGGEPTIHADISFFMRDLHEATSKPIYLETNGLAPDILTNCYRGGLSFINLSYKYPIRQYGTFASDLKATLSVLRSKPIPYVITSVIHKSLVSPIAFRDMASLVLSDEVWVLSKALKKDTCLNPDHKLFSEDDYTEQELTNLLSSVRWASKHVSAAKPKETKVDPLSETREIDYEDLFHAEFVGDDVDTY